jgi:excinuclease ABC subunit B
MGRAARHVNGKAILYADTVTESMAQAINETNRRREKQVAYNREHGIVPASIVKEVRDLTERVRSVAEERVEYRVEGIPKDESLRLIKELEKQMKTAAAALEFEKAALLRDQIIELRRGLEDESIPEWERIRQWEERHAREQRGAASPRPVTRREDTRGRAHARAGGPRYRS